RLLARRSAGAVLKPSGGNYAVLPMCLFSFLCQSAPETAEEKQPDRPQPIKNSRFAKKRNF
ncbi:hypothetical protein, partial [Gemmiger sp.]|uniref:hypothetical protein n=1 Tax=Gemmiger sp. TaxID=2049027 RepID=UPI003FD8218B